MNRVPALCLLAALAVAPAAAIAGPASGHAPAGTAFRVDHEVGRGQEAAGRAAVPHRELPVRPRQRRAGQEARGRRSQLRHGRVLPLGGAAPTRRRRRSTTRSRASWPRTPPRASAASSRPWCTSRLNQGVDFAQVHPAPGGAGPGLPGRAADLRHPRPAPQRRRPRRQARWSRSRRPRRSGPARAWTPSWPTTI